MLEDLCNSYILDVDHKNELYIFNIYTHTKESSLGIYYICTCTLYIETKRLSLVL